MRELKNRYFLVEVDNRKRLQVARWCDTTDLKEWVETANHDRSLEEWAEWRVVTLDEENDEWVWMPPGETETRGMTDEEILRAYERFMAEKGRDAQFYGPTHPQFCKLMDHFETRHDLQDLVDAWMLEGDMMMMRFDDLRDFVRALPLDSLKYHNNHADESTFLCDNFKIAWEAVLQKLALDHGIGFWRSDLVEIVDGLLLDAEEQTACKQS